MKLGTSSELTLTAARERALSIKRDVNEGKDPAAFRSAAMNRPTVAMLADWHVERHAQVKMKPAGAKEARRVWDRDVLPALGPKTAVEDVTEADIANLHHSMRKRPIHANRVMAQLSKAFNLAESWAWRPRHSNPVQVERYVENKRKRLPTGQEPVRLMAAMERMRGENPTFISFVELIALTGARAGEIRTAKWAWVQDDGLHLPDSKTGEKVLPLSDLARDVLKTIPRIQGNPHIITGRVEGKPMSNYWKSWQRLLAIAGIKNLRTHDMRRFFASAGLSQGESLSAIGEVLGHASAETTKRYAFLMTDAATETANKAANNVKRLMRGA
jgi:integrase